MTCSLMNPVSTDNRFKYPAVTESWRTFPGAKLAAGWGLEVVVGARRG
jgi:hypothetical protein